MTSILAIAILSRAPIVAYDADDIVSKNFRDATFVASLLKSDQKELQKINRDFAASQRFGTSKAWLKEPLMIRMESKVQDTDVFLLINGTRRRMSVPKIKLSKTEDLAMAPGKRQTFLDFGLLTPSLFKELYVAKFVRVDRESGNLVFDLTFQPKLDDSSMQKVWVDKDKRYITKRVWFNQDGRQLATFIYSQPKNVGGVWFPTNCVVKNVEDKVAGITEYRSMAINTGLDDSLFKF